MKLFTKISTRILLLSSAFLVIVIGVSWFLLQSHKQSDEFVCGIQTPTFFCGNANLSEEAQEGKRLFNSTCAACHKLNARMTGPALRNTDSIVFHKWMYYENSKIDTTKLDQIGLDYHRNLSKNNFKIVDLNTIFEYIKDTLNTTVQ